MSARAGALVAQAASGDSVRPFNVNVPDADLAELPPSHQRDSVARSRDGIERLAGRPLATMQALAAYWAGGYDWRKCEAKVNALPQFLTEIDGLEIHFIHVRSKHEERAAGHRYARLARLDSRTAKAHRAANRSHRARRNGSRRV